MVAWIKVLIAFLASFLAGFWFGRKVGKSEGFQLGLSFSPLDIRRKSLERGRCLVCGRNPVPLPDESSHGGGPNTSPVERVIEHDQDSKTAWPGE